MARPNARDTSFPATAALLLTPLSYCDNHIDMGGASNSSPDSELDAAKAAVEATLRDANTSALFGQPVDPTLLPDYLDIVKHPKDLGSILGDLEASLQGSGPYTTAQDVLNDVQLVWTNCLQYNNRPEDKPIVDICRLSSKLFNKEWRKAGLSSNKSGKGSRSKGDGTRAVRRGPEPPESTPMIVDGPDSNGKLLMGGLQDADADARTDVVLLAKI